MFLEPTPLRGKASRDMSSGFFSSQRSSQRPIAATRDPSRSVWRQALHERSNSQHNQQTSIRSPDQPTVRLVSPSPSPSPPTRYERVSGKVQNAGKENEQPRRQEAEHGLPQSKWAEDTSVSDSGNSAASQAWSVSDSHDWTQELHISDSTPSITLLSTASAHELPPPTWHRRSISSGTYSQSSTLQESEIAFSKKSLKSERYSSFSQRSTLRGTPTPYEDELHERAEIEGPKASGSALTLQTLEETSHERSRGSTTIRPVSPSDSSSPSEEESASVGTDSTAIQPQIASPDSERSPVGSLVKAFTTNSAYSSRGRANTYSSLSPYPEGQLERPGSLRASDLTSPQNSSPNFVAFCPDSSSPTSRGDHLRSVASIESILSDTQREGALRPTTSQTLESSSSWASLRSNDTLPPLQVPKKRLRHKAKSASLASLAASSYIDDTMDDEIDTQPYPKRPFSSHLSTIASESDHSRNTSQHLSHFSIGSGVLTGDDASSLLFSPKRRRQNSAPVESIISDTRPDTRGTSSTEFVDEAGDMTLGIYREESAIPQPLFKANQVRMMDTGRRYDVAPPAMPTEPRSRDSDENIDTLSALQAPPLRQQKSGRSLRRTNATPAHSRQQSQVSTVDSERFSQGSNLFPMWAKRFYSGTVQLRSKTSLASISNSERQPAMHRRAQSWCTDRSTGSRLGTGMNEEQTASPGSSHFLPSIFRPKTRLYNPGNSQTGSRSPRTRNGGQSRTSEETEGSMAITPAPPLAGERDRPSMDEVLPSGQPRWGILKGSPSHSPDTQRRLPKKYSKQRLWDQMEFPRPMTKDRLSDFSMSLDPPRLAPSKRVSQQQLSKWQAPSFSSNLDTLVTSQHNRQILCFLLGFACPLIWMLGAVLPLPHRPLSVDQIEKSIADTEEDVQTAMMKHEVGDAERRWREERQYLKARWWRMLNRIMSVVGIFIIGAIVALVVVATTS